MKNPKVAHLVYDLIRGGTEGQCARVAMGLARRGLTHRVAVFHRRGFFLEEVESICGPVHEMAVRHMLRPSTLSEVGRMVRWLKRERMEILHAWDADSAIFGQFVACWAGIPLVTSRRDMGQIYPPYKLVLMRCADRAATRVVTNAKAIRDHFVHRGLPEDKTVVLPNLLDLTDFDEQTRLPFSQEMHLPPGRRMVVVNRLDEEKHTGLLIEALPLVRERIENAVLIIAGAGTEMKNLQMLAVRSGVEKSVCFLDEILDVPALLSKCEAGALVPWRNEGLSNTILEYMAARLPVLATDCGGNRELVRERETGYLIPTTASPAEVAVAWISILEEPDLARSMGRQARHYVEHSHAPDAVLQKFARLYEEISCSTAPWGKERSGRNRPRNGFSED